MIDLIYVMTKLVWREGCWALSGHGSNSCICEHAGRQRGRPWQAVVDAADGAPRYGRPGHAGPYIKHLHDDAGSHGRRRRRRRRWSAAPRTHGRRSLRAHEQHDGGPPPPPSPPSRPRWAAVRARPPNAPRRPPPPRASRRPSPGHGGGGSGGRGGGPASRLRHRELHLKQSATHITFAYIFAILKNKTSIQINTNYGRKFFMMV